MARSTARAGSSFSIRYPSSDLHRTGGDLFVDAFGDLHIAPLGVVEVERALDLAGVETVGDQVHLAGLEGAGGLDGRQDAHEERLGVGRQFAGHALAERLDVELGPDHQAGHAGAALGAFHGDAIDIGFLHAGTSLQVLGDLVGGDVLALPAVGVADPVDEIEVAVGVGLHQVAGGEPGVALLEDVAQDLLLRRGLVHVAGVLAAGVAADLADAFADLAGAGLYAEPVQAPDRLLGLHVELHQADVELFAQPLGRAANGAFAAIEVEHRDIAFRRAVELEDLGDVEALLHHRPDVRAQAVAEGHA